MRMIKIEPPLVRCFITRRLSSERPARRIVRFEKKFLDRSARGLVVFNQSARGRLRFSGSEQRTGAVLELTYFYLSTTSLDPDG